MDRLKTALVCVFLCATLLAAQGAPALEQEMLRLSKQSGGTMGVTVVHLETGRRASVNGGEAFPMASTFKVPVAVALFARVDRGEERLDRMITLEPKDLHPGSGTLNDLFTKPGVSLSVRNIVELMLLISDNTAADIALRLAGGAQGVNARLREIGIKGVRVDRPTVNLIADWAGVNLPPENQWQPGFFTPLARAVTPEQAKAAHASFDRDPQDTSTPDGMAALLQHIYKRDLLKPDTADLLLDIMRRCQTGDARLKGILPAGTVVEHKTGSIGGTTNDVGIITLPGDAGHVAIAAFVKSSEKPVAERERAIAEVARAAHDYFLFLPK